MKLIVYTDGWARGNPWHSGLGVIIDAADGKELERRYKYLWEGTNNRAEALGAFYGIKRAIELGADEIDLFMDSMLIVEQLNGRWKIKDADLKKIHADIKTLLLEWSGKLNAKHIAREHNTRADALSNKAMDEGMGIA